MERTTSPARLDSANRREMGLVVPAHHSLADWNFQAGVGFAISSARFVSSPSALRRPTDATQGSLGRFALKESISGNLLDGRFITFILFEHIALSDFRVYARSQTSPHLANPPNTYYFTLRPDRVIFSKRVANVEGWLADGLFFPTLTINTWRRFRLTWYTWLDAALEPTLRVIAEHEQAGTWVHIFTHDIASPLWQTSLTNLTGMELMGPDDLRQNWVDDTMVYKRST